MSDRVIKGQLVLREYTVLSTALAPLTGVVFPGGVEFFLHRGSGSTMIAASEAIAWAEIGTSGHYYVSFTPLTENVEYALTLHELHGSSRKAWHKWTFEAVAAGADFAPTFADAYCSEADVERWAQMDYSSTSDPSLAEVTAFAAGRASELTSEMARLGLSITPPTVVQTSTEGILLREANAIGAAADSLWAQYSQRPPRRIEKVGELLDELERRLVPLYLYAREVLAGLTVATPITAGELTLPVVTSEEDAGVDPLFEMSRDW